MIAAACTARAPVAPATQRPVRSWRALVVARAQRAPVQRPKPLAALQAVVRALETAAVVAAVGAHVAAAATTVRQQQAAAAQRSQQQVEQQNGRRVAHVAAAPAVPQGLAVQPPAWAAPSGLWLTLPLLAALVLGRIRAWLSGSSEPRRVSTEAAARLLRAEAAAGQQAQRIEELARQLDKLSVRSRVGGRDLKLPIQQLQAVAGQQAEALVSVAARMEKLEKEIRDTEELVGAMQGVSAKQFALLLKVLEQQQAQQAQQARQAAQGAEPPRQQQAQAQQQQAEQQQKAAARSPAAGSQPSPAGAQQQGGSAAAAGQAAAGQTDEWGRTVRPLPSSSRAPSPPQATPPLPSASPARAMSMGDPVCPLGSLPTPSCSADAMAAAAAAAAAEGPLSYDGNEEEGQAQQTEQAQQAQQARQRQGLNQDSLLGIMGEDDFWKAEQQIISAVVNQPKAAQKPEVEILPPLFPPPPELTPEEAALQRKRREQVEEWRMRMRRSWDMSQLEAALEASHTEERKKEEEEAASQDEEEGAVGAAAAVEAPTMPDPSSEPALNSSSADAGSSAADAGGSSAADAGSSSAAAFGGGHSLHGGSLWGGSGGSFGGDHSGDDGGDD